MSSQLIRIFDTTLRDGEQAAGVCFSLEDKLEIARALEAMDVDVIEAGFPQASPSEARAVAAVARHVRDAEVCALARAVPADVDAAAEAVREAARPRVHVFVGCSALNLEHKDLLAGFLRVADMVKFALHEPTVNESDVALAAARRFVDETTPPAAGAAVEDAA